MTEGKCKTRSDQRKRALELVDAKAMSHRSRQVGAQRTCATQGGSLPLLMSGRVRVGEVAA